MILIMIEITFDDDSYKSLVNINSTAKMRFRLCMIFRHLILLIGSCRNVNAHDLVRQLTSNM